MRNHEWPSGPNAMASINPPTYAGEVANPQNRLERRQIYYPEPLVPVGPNVGLQPRIYTLQTVADQVSGTPVTRTQQFDIPAIVYGFVATAVTSDGSDLAAGLDPRDTFRCRIEYTSTGDQFTAGQTNPLGSMVFGTGDTPALIGGQGLIMDSGTSLFFSITPRFDNLEIDIALYAIEVRGPQNYTVR